MNGQWFINSVSDGSIYFLVALGFAFIYRTARFFDFSFAALLAVAPYAVISWREHGGLPAILAALLGVLSTTVIAVLVDLFLFGRLRKHAASNGTMLLVSLGVFLVLRNTLSAIWSDEAIVLGGQSDPTYPMLGGRITEVQTISIIIAVLAGVGATVTLRTTLLGRWVNAIASDPELAQAVGIPVSRVLGVLYGAAAIATGIAGVLLARDVGLTPNLGFRPFLFAVVAVVLAGSFASLRVAFGCFLVAVVQNYVLWKLGPAWQEGLIFLVFLVVVIARSIRKGLVVS